MWHIHVHHKMYLLCWYIQNLIFDDFFSSEQYSFMDFSEVGKTSAHKTKVIYQPRFDPAGYYERLKIIFLWKVEGIQVLCGKISKSSFFPTESSANTKDDCSELKSESLVVKKSMVWTRMNSHNWIEALVSAWKDFNYPK